MNYIRTTFLMAALTALFLGAGFLLGGEGGMIIALLFAIATNAFAYWNSGKMVLAMHGAKAVDSANAPKLVSMVNGLADQAGLPYPKVYIIENAQPNAFATGRNPDHAAVAVTSGLLNQLNSHELEGVIAHELAHIKNYDILIMSITATIAGALSMLANFALFFGNNRNNPLGLLGTILVMILAPIAAMLVQMAISRTREYEADRVGAEISGNPIGLADALRRISSGSRDIINETAEANPSTAHLFISNPLSGRGLDSLFATHPPMGERIKRLEDMANRGGWSRPTRPYRQSSHPPTTGQDRGKSHRPGPWG